MRARERNAGLTSKLGFSVVAPIRVSSPDFPMRQQGVLLGLIKTVNLVEKQDGAGATGAQPLGFRDGLAHVLDACRNGRQGNEMRADLAGEQPRQGGLADAGWSPQDQAAQPAGLQHAGQRPARAKQMCLSHHFGHRMGAQAFGQRRGRVEQGHAASIGRARGSWHEGFFHVRA
ncbi:hypothetical protein GCM10008955_20620 [Deinococcus malanensis]|uniref:Uncharacterized protein n=1 Tax=Deinococcus malanensis TaxID=1706855 RepID=A0ABQ2EUS6_9DEIO|nr:hypothetical protein GCM10008955_20620 [Deinococcus malanensis]